METMIKKQSMGRQKIEIKKIEKKTNLQVSFSKRRRGLFKKVAELSTLCGADAAAFVRSPGGKLFASSNPSPEHVIERYLESSKNVEKIRVDEEDLEKKKEEEKEMFWWRGVNMEGLGLGELEEMKKALEEVKRKIDGRREEMTMEMMTWVDLQ